MVLVGRNAIIGLILLRSHVKVAAMDLFLKISYAIICLFIVWRIYLVIKRNPEIMSRENLSRSFFSMAVLALILIGAVAMMVMLLRA